MALKKSQKSLKSWTKQKWRTKSGKPSAKTGERYLPEKAIKSLSAKEYAATTRKKREDTAIDRDWETSFTCFSTRFSRLSTPLLFSPRFKTFL